jgi:hypothetical protein
MRNCLVLLLSVLSVSVFTPHLCAQQSVTLTAQDGTKVFGTYYPAPNVSAPIILLFHQAGSNRWEYTPIAPVLNSANFSSLAIDAVTETICGATRMRLSCISARKEPTSNLLSISKPLLRGHVSNHIASLDDSFEHHIRGDGVVCGQFSLRECVGGVLLAFNSEHTVRLSESMTFRSNGPRFVSYA